MYDRLARVVILRYAIVCSGMYNCPFSLPLYIGECSVLWSQDSSTWSVEI